MAKVTVIIDGDERPLKKSVDAAVRELSRLEKAADRLANPYQTNKLPSQYNNLSRQQLAEVQRIARERARLNEIEARRESQLAVQTARARMQAENNYFRFAENQRKRDFQEYQRIERQKTAIANAEARKRLTAAQAGQTLQNVGQGTRQAGTALTAGVTAPIVVASKSLLTAGIEYEKALNIFQAVTKATGVEMDLAAKRAKELGADLSLPATSAKDAALAMVELGKAGLTANQAIAATKGVLQLAAAAQIDEARAAEIAANALNSFNLQASETTRVADLLAAASNASSAEIGDIAEAMQQASAVFAGAGISIEHLTAAIALMANAGIKGSDAGTSLKTFLQRLRAPTDEAADAMNRLGVDIFDAQGKMKDFPAIIGQFDKALAGLNEEQKAQVLNTIFGADAIRAAEILFKTGEAGLNKMTATVGVLGSAADLASAKTKGLGGAWDAFKSQLETVGIEIYEIVKTPLTNFMRDAATTVAAVGQAFSTLSPEVQSAILTLIALAAAAGPVLVIFGSLVSAIGTLVTAGSAIVGVFTTVGVAVGAAAGSFAAFAAGVGTVGLVIAGLAVVFAPAIAAAAEFYLVWTTNFGGVKTFILQVIAGIQTAYNAFLKEFSALTAQVTAEAAAFWQANGADIMKAVQTVTEVIESVVRAFIGVVGALWRENSEEIKAIVSAAWAVIKTVTIAGVRIVLNTIKLISAVINGDWAKAWEAVKNIVSSALTAVGAIIAGQFAIIINAIKGIATAIYATAVEIGKNLIQGLISGMLTGRGTLYETAKSIINSAINIFRSEAKVESPSKVTMEIGHQIGEGLAIGIENKVKRVQVAARRMTAEALKELREATKEFQRFAGASPQTVATLQRADETRQAAQDQREIIDLRKTLGVNQFKPLPSTVIGTQDEVADLRRRKEAADELSKTYDKLRDGVTKMQEAESQFNEDVSKRLEAMRTSGELALLDLAEQIDLEGVLDEHQRRQIENLYEIERLRIELSNDGWGETLVNEALEIAKANQQAREELERILAVRKQVAGAESLGRDLQSELEFLQRGGRELTEYERTLQKINTDYKDISESQKQYLLNMAAQVDAQRKFNEQYAQTFNFIRDAFDILTDESQSFGDNIKNLFKSIADRFKQMVLDMAATWLTNKIFGAGGGGQSSGGILGGIFGGGGGGQSASGGGNILSQILGGLFGGGGRAGGTPPFVSNFSGGGSLPTNISSGAQIRNLAGFGFLDQKTTGGGRLPGTIAAIGAITSIAGGLIGGRIGQTIGNIGTGVGLGATIGSIIPGVGTVIGAIVGGAIGFFASLFGDPKRKRDKNEKLPALQQGFADALKALRELAANKRAIQSDPQGAITQADTLRGQIASGFGIQFESSKYRKQAQQMIQARLAEADTYIKQIKEFAKKAESASLRPILPEFASGGFMDARFTAQHRAYQQQYGILRGGIPGVDSIWVKAQDGELFANRAQQRRINEIAGFDVLSHVGFPNYPRPKEPVKMATGGYIGTLAPSSPSITVQSPPIELHLEGVIYTEHTKAWLQTKDGQKTVLDIVKDGKKYNGI
jgi:TP901 family phage tail tape measure protein